MDIDFIVLKIAEKVREIATRQGNVPFLTGDLRKSIIVHHLGAGRATVGSNLPYARPVHDGRKAITIRPNLNKNPRSDPKKARLKFNIGGKTVFAKEVHQPARKGRPFLKDAVVEVQKSGYDFLRPGLVEEIGEAAFGAFIRAIKTNRG